MKMISKLQINVNLILFALVIVMIPSLQAMAMHADPHHSFLGGPWELVVKMGLGGDGLRFPITVSEESKPQKLHDVLPVLKSPIKIKLEHYIPDLAWETTAIPHPGGGIVAQLTIKGKNLEQSILLNPGDPARQSVTSRIGSIAIRKLYNSNSAEALVRKLVDRKAVGVLSIWSKENDQPFECIVKGKQKFTLPGSRYKINVAQYVPHYSIDTKTKKVSSLSDEPVNPAIRVILNDGKKTSERWLWAKFLSSPHEQEKLPFRMRFTDFNLQNTTGHYILVTAGREQVWILQSEKRRNRLEKAKSGRSYFFADKQYSFNIEKILDEAIIKTQWKNKSNRLLRPAIVTTIERDRTEQQTVLELNKPFHLKTKTGVLVLLYRRRPAVSKTKY